MTLPAKLNSDAAHIVDEREIQSLLGRPPLKDAGRLREILDKGKTLSGLTLDEAADLLTITDAASVVSLFEAARQVKEEIYGKRLVLFAPLYVSNFCSNSCSYCAFNAESHNIKRRALTQEEVAREVEKLISSGHKRLLLVAGESHARSHLDYITETLDTIYAVGDTNRIRRVNVNIAPLEVAQFEELKAHNIGTYQLFQETYHRPTYARVHTRGPKADYDYRLTAMDRAMSAGIDDVGIGALFGLYSYEYEVLALLQHVRHLEQAFGTGPHTISVPRLEPAAGAPTAQDPPAPLADADFEKVIAVLRLAVPYTGLILSTREAPSMRARALSLGISQISAGSRTNPGGYCEAGVAAEPQFQLGDHRSLDEVIRDVLSQGFIPSFCTGCYRKGRTGSDFMDLAKPGLIKQFCLPNALLTLKEYLEDFASDQTRAIGEEIIASQISEIPGEERRQETVRRLEAIAHDQRDLDF